MKYELIYTLGRGVDAECNMKGARGDLLLRNMKGEYYELNYISIERLTNSLDENDSCFFDSNLIIVLNMDFETILKSIKSLIKQSFIEWNWRPLTIEQVENFYYPIENWETYEITNDL